MLLYEEKCYGAIITCIKRSMAALRRRLCPPSGSGVLHVDQVKAHSSFTSRFIPFVSLSVSNVFSLCASSPCSTLMLSFLFRVLQSIPTLMMFSLLLTRAHCKSSNALNKLWHGSRWLCSMVTKSIQIRRIISLPSIVTQNCMCSGRLARPGMREQRMTWKWLKM